MAINGTGWLTPYSTATNAGGGNFLPFGRAANGRLSVPLPSDLNNAATPQDKLQLAGQLAAKLQLQADTAAKTGVTGQLPQITAQASRLLDAVGSVVAGLTGAGGSALQPYRQSLSAVLGTLNAVAKQIAVLLPETASGVSPQTATAINELNAQAAALAKEAGVSWQPVSVRITAATNTPAAASAAVGGTARLVDIVA